MSLLQYGQLRQTHPRIGKAMYGVWIEHLTSEDWGNRQVAEILSHDEEIKVCAVCGAREHYQVLVERILVGPNEGLVVVSRSRTCLGTPPCGSWMASSGG